MKLEKAEYSYSFSDIGSTPSSVHVTAANRDIPTSVKIAIDDDEFLYRRHSWMEPHIADLVDIAVAVYVADRLSLCQQSYQQRSISVCLPLRHPEVFEQANICDLLSNTLYHFTHDEWAFHFSKRVKKGRMSELQTSIGEAPQFVEVALWSGGLDSFAGLNNRVEMHSSSLYTLFGTGSNLLIQSVQDRTARQVRKIFPSQNIKLEQVPFRLIKLDPVRQNSTPRSRGFLFLLLGAVCAYLEGQNVLHVYENGIGAINLPYLKSSTGLDHSRAVHPLSLVYMSDLVSAILGAEFVIRNPFLFWTKAQMCALPVKLERHDLIASTVTCDHRRRSQHIHCSRCSSCLLRRQALLANGLQDQAYLVPSMRRVDGCVKPSDGAFLRVMLHQVEVLRRCITSHKPWDALAHEYPDLPSVAWSLASTHQGEQEDIEQHLVQLYRQYISEWDIPGLRYQLSRQLLLDKEMSAFV